MNAIVAIGGAALFRVVKAYRAAVPSAIWVLGLKTAHDPNDPLVRSLEALLEPFMEQYFIGAAQANIAEFDAQLVSQPLPSRDLDSRRVGDAVPVILANGLASAMALIEMLDRAHASQPVELVLTDDSNESSSTAIAWARARGLPSATVPANAPLRRPRLPIADCTFVVGERARRAYRAIDADESLLTVLAVADAQPQPPAEYDVRRAEAKAAFTRVLGWSATDLIVVFEPGSRVRESALEPRDAFGVSLSAMFAAFTFAHKRVPTMRLAVVTQPSPDGDARTAQAAAAAGVLPGEYAYSQGEQDVWVAGADIIVASDSACSIDAASRGIPTVNLWQPHHWYQSPAFGAEDGVISAAVPSLGGTLVALSGDAELSAQIAAIAFERLSADSPGSATAVAAVAGELVRRRRPAPPTRRKSKPDIAIWAPDYSHSSGGVRALFRLCHLINLVGGNATMLEATKLHPTWNTPRRDTPLTERTVTIVPEIVFAQPSAKRIVRWVLNKPGFLNGPTTYGPHEMVFYYAKAFREAAQAATLETLTDERELNLFTVEPELFFNDRSVPRLYDCVFVGKGDSLYRRLRARLTRDALMISRSWPQNRAETAALLRGCRRFYSYDAHTAIALEAAICGAQVFTVLDNGELAEGGSNLPDVARRYYEISHVERFLELITERWQ